MMLRRSLSRMLGVARRALASAAIVGIIAAPLLTCVVEAARPMSPHMTCGMQDERVCHSAMEADCCTAFRSVAQEVRGSGIAGVTLTVVAHPATDSASPVTTHAVVRPAQIIDTSPPDISAFSVLLI
jgi:hypothetical protein